MVATRSLYFAPELERQRYDLSDPRLGGNKAIEGDELSQLLPKRAAVKCDVIRTTERGNGSEVSL